MAGNTYVEANAGSGGANFAGYLDGSSVLWPYGLLAFLESGTIKEAGSANPVPVTLANTGANATALKVDNSAVTQPISAAALPLPTGAATAAKQPALGTAGAAATDVLSIQGIAGMTAVKVDNSGVTQPVSGTVTATLGATTNAGATVKTADLDSGAGVDNVTVFGIAIAGSGGAQAAGHAANPLQVSIANTGANGTAIKTDGSGVTQPVSGTVTANAGTGTMATSNATLDAAAYVQSATIGSGKGLLAMYSEAGTAVFIGGTSSAQWGIVRDAAGNSRGANVNASNELQVSATGTVTANLAPTTSGGLSTSKTISAASTNATSVKATAGQLYGVQAFNKSTSARYLKFYDKASAPTVGTDTPVKTFILPGLASASGTGAGLIYVPVQGIAFANGIAFAITGDLPDADTTAIGANDVVVNLDYA